jgi:hypothetical protein
MRAQPFHLRPRMARGFADTVPGTAAFAESLFFAFFAFFTA